MATGLIGVSTLAMLHTPERRDSPVPSASASPAWATANQEERENGALVRKALVTIGRFRSVPNTISKPECEADDWCETRADLGEETWLAAKYLRPNTQAVRFSFHAR